MDKENNKIKFINLLKSIDRPGANIEGLINYLNKSDFFTAPASTKYHSNFEGGLCIHSLNVYYRLKDLINIFYKQKSPYSETSLILVALGHDFAKINFYEQIIKTKKIYSPQGTKRDNLGKYEFESYYSYGVKDPKERVLFGAHGQNSERILSNYIPLSDEESIAIIWHMGGMDDIKCNDLSDIYNKFPLASLLHSADYLSTYIDERI